MKEECSAGPGREEGRAAPFETKAGCTAVYFRRRRASLSRARLFCGPSPDARGEATRNPSTTLRKRSVNNRGVAKALRRPQPQRQMPFGRRGRLLPHPRVGRRGCVFPHPKARDRWRPPHLCSTICGVLNHFYWLAIRSIWRVKGSSARRQDVSIPR